MQATRAGQLLNKLTHAILNDYYGYQRLAGHLFIAVNVVVQGNRGAHDDRQGLGLSGIIMGQPQRNPTAATRYSVCSVRSNTEEMRRGR